MTTKYEAVVEITHLPGIADPQGATVERSLPALGYDNVSQVRVGKSIRLVVEAATEADARRPGRGDEPAAPQQPGDRGVHGDGERATASRVSRLAASEPMNIAVVVFPGTNCELDVAWSVEQLGAQAELVWHAEASLPDVDAVVVPGGFAHGDYLRTGAIARFSPVMAAVGDFAAAGAARRRHLQRLPGAHRGGPAPRCAAEERGAQVPVRDRRVPGRVDPFRAHHARDRRRRAAHPHQPLRGELRVRRGDPRRAPRRRPHRAALRRQPERLASTTSPGSATRPATSSGSCRTPSARPTRCSARPTASCCCESLLASAQRRSAVA